MNSRKILIGLILATLLAIMLLGYRLKDNISIVVTGYSSAEKGNHSDEVNKVFLTSDTMYQPNNETRKNEAATGQRNEKPLYVFQQGYKGIGNNMGVFASTFCIAKTQGRKVIWGGLMKRHLTELFPSLVDQLHFNDSIPDWETMRDIKLKYKKIILPQTNISLGGYPLALGHFESCQEELFQMLKLNQSLVKKVNNSINHVKQMFLNKNKTVGSRDLTVVGVHIRRGDKVKMGGKSQGYYIPTAEEIGHAMDYMRVKHGSKTVFLIASDGRTWCEKNLLKNKDTFMMPRGDANQDFVTLATCDHMIITQSTFSWWSAWLLDQRVMHDSHWTRQPDILFFKNPYHNGTRLNNMYRREEHYPPSWKYYTLDSIEGLN